MTVWVYDIETAPEKNKEPGEEVKSWQRNALNPLKGRITAIGKADVDDSKVTNVDVRLNEDELLRNFWEDVERGDIFWGFNNYAFDDRFLTLRSLKYNVLPDFAKGEASKSLYHDLREILRMRTYKPYGTLNDFCKHFGIQNDDELEGSQMPELFYNADYGKIKDHLWWDIVSTKALYTKLLEKRWLKRK